MDGILSVIEFLVFRATAEQQLIAGLLVGLTFGFTVCAIGFACSAIADTWRGRALRNGRRVRRA